MLDLVHGLLIGMGIAHAAHTGQKAICHEQAALAKRDKRVDL